MATRWDATSTLAWDEVRSEPAPRAQVIHAPAYRTAEQPAWWREGNLGRFGLSLWRHRHLVARFAWREFRSRYQGSTIGLAWSFVQPLLLLATYVFVFRCVLGVQWQAEDETTLHFALTLLAGLVTFNLFAEVVQRSPGLIVAHANLVKKVVFPVEMLPLTTLLGTLGHAALALALVVTLFAVTSTGPGWNVLWLPLILVPYWMFILGCGWLLSSLGTFIRDVGPIVTVCCQLLVFLTPIVYPMRAVPAEYRGLIGWNPLTMVVDGVRRALLWDQPPSWSTVGILWLLGLVAMQVGYAWFTATRRAFADVV